MSKVELILYSCILAIFVGLSSAIIVLHKKLETRTEQYEIAASNNKAYQALSDSLLDKNVYFQFTVAQLMHQKDSVTEKLKYTLEELKIKDKNIKSLEYLNSLVQKTDTLVLHDTIFRQNYKLDTLIQDEWSSLKLHLQYPNELSTSYNFRNETIVVASQCKETIDPPKKFFLLRWFQKKHTIIKVDVTQNNPHCTEDKFIHYDIIK